MMTNPISKRSKRLFTHFKALGSPIRFLIIYKMLDGRPYTKNEIVDYVSVLTGVPKTTVDRHFRTLLKYGVIKLPVSLLEMARKVGSHYYTCSQ